MSSNRSQSRSTSNRSKAEEDDEDEDLDDYSDFGEADSDEDLSKDPKQMDDVEAFFGTGKGDIGASFRSTGASQRASENSFSSRREKKGCFKSLL